MFCYLFLVLMAYYIVKPVSRSMFLTKFDVDKLPWLYILIAATGGFFAYLYARLAARTSLSTAVFWTMLLSVVSLAAMWAFIHFHWMIYVLNIWVSLFSVVLVSQGWLVASNIFNAREAKRLYPLLGMAMVLGAAFGGEFTSRTVRLVGTQNLLLACAAIVVLAYAAFRAATRHSVTGIGQAPAGSEEATNFSFTAIVRDLVRVRHLQVIVSLMVAMYIVDTLVEYQLQYVAARAYHGDNLTAFFGRFYGLYLNGIEAVFQLFVTGAVLTRFGVGYTLQIAPACVGLCSIAAVVAPGVASGSAVRLTEASTRYTFNRTGMELLYMPLPKALRNRVKAFIDICVDRLSRGLGGVLLLLLTGRMLHLGIRGISMVVMGFCVVWARFAHKARKEYVESVQRRLESTRVDLPAERITVTDAHTVRLLEETAGGKRPRQAAYALELLAEAPGYDVRPLLHALAQSPAREVHEKVYELAGALRFDGVLVEAMSEIRAADAGQLMSYGHSPSHAVVAYAITVSPERTRLAAELLDSGVNELVQGALEGLRSDRELAQKLISREWINKMASSADPRRRALAAIAVGDRGDQGIEVLHALLQDADPEPTAAACRAAGLLRTRSYVYALVDALGNPRLRPDAISALAAYGPSICGTLGDILMDETAPIHVRRQLPRVLKNIPHQSSVDVLLRAIGHDDIILRTAALKALNRLRQIAPNLHFESRFMTPQILIEAQRYFELNAALEPFRSRSSGHRSASSLLARTLEGHLRDTLDRLFRLLGLQYPPKEIYAAYQAVSQSRSEEAAAALEFLDGILDHDLKRILLPLLDGPEYVLDHGRELFGIEPLTVEQALRILLEAGDPWLRACAAAAAAELKLRSLAPEIERAAAEPDKRVSQVARFAAAALAAV